MLIKSRTVFICVVCLLLSWDLEGIKDKLQGFLLYFIYLFIIFSKNLVHTELKLSAMPARYLQIFITVTRILRRGMIGVMLVVT